MKWKHRAIVLCCVAAGCTDGTGDDGETLATLQEDLSNGQNQGSLLTLRGSSLPASEFSRQQDTAAYYATVGVSPNGSTAGGTIASQLGTLSQFITRYGLGGANEVRTQYYNRGDLGIGRDMHCVDNLNVAGNNQIACYVRNFGSDTLDGGEFTFGLSTNIAFANLEANHPFATVAMVYRDQMAIDSKNRVFFVVYDAAGNRSNFAALDRHGVQFAGEFAHTTPNNPASQFGTPGSTLNNHIPSNCVSCHGGQQYDPTTHSQVGALFLPFDLDQFEYEAVAGKTRADQLTAFKHQNEMARKVSSLSVSGANAAGTSIKNQLDNWYGNVTFQTNRTEVFEGNFNSNAVIAGWTSQPGIFQSVVRRSCRNCHMSNQVAVTFDTQSQFDTKAAATASFLCGRVMPHSLQTLREFWFSTAPAGLVSYFNAVGQGGAAGTLQGCGPGDVATLDPPQMMAGLTAATILQ